MVIIFNLIVCLSLLLWIVSVSEGIFFKHNLLMCFPERSSHKLHALLIWFKTTKQNLFWFYLALSQFIFSQVFRYTCRLLTLLLHLVSRLWIRCCLYTAEKTHKVTGLIVKTIGIKRAHSWIHGRDHSLQFY